MAADTETESGGRRGQSQENDDDIEVLEFVLGDTRYCTDIGHVEEVVEADGDDLTPVPNSPQYVAGVMDLRGETTTIVDPKRLYDVVDGEAGDMVIVFDSNQIDSDGSTGWLVDRVDRVSDISLEEIDTNAADDTGVHGVINRSGKFVLLVDPGAINHHSTP